MSERVLLHLDESAAAACFVDYRARVRELSTFPGQVPRTMADAYRFQDLAIGCHIARGPRHLAVAGWKIGLVPESVRVELKTTRFIGPIWGDEVAFADDDRPATGAVFPGRGLIEAELIVRVGQRKLPTGASFEETFNDVEIFLGAELGGTPINDLNGWGPAALTAAFGNCSGIAVGPRLFRGPFDPVQVNNAIGASVVETRIGGLPVGTGSTHALPGGIGAALRAAHEFLGERGRRIAPRSFFATGALTGVHEVAEGDQVEIAGVLTGSMKIEIVSRFRTQGARE